MLEKKKPEISFKFEDMFASDHIKPYDIVSSAYVDLSGDIKTFKENSNAQKGLFLIINVTKGNAIALKITSQHNHYITPETSFTLLKSTHQFLMADSYIQLDKPHTLYVNQCNKIGSLQSNLRYKFLILYQNYLQRLIYSLKDNVEYCSPNLR